jgi:hypothetical protein
MARWCRCRSYRRCRKASLATAAHPKSRFPLTDGSSMPQTAVAIFAADPATGFLWTVDIVRTGDKTSRFFALAPDSGFMFVGHEDSDTIAAFTVDQETDRIAATDNMISTRGPVCIVCSAEWSCLRQCFVRAPQSPSRTFGSAASVMCLGSSSSECIR